MTNTLQCIVNHFGALIIVIFAFEEELLTDTCKLGESKGCKNFNGYTPVKVHVACSCSPLLSFKV